MMIAEWMIKLQDVAAEMPEDLRPSIRAQVADRLQAVAGIVQGEINDPSIAVGGMPKRWPEECDVFDIGYLPRNCRMVIDDID